MNFTKLFIFSFFFSFLFRPSFSQNIVVHVFTEYKTAPGNNDTIYYDFNKKLAWNDFQGTVPANVPWGAMTASGFSFNSSMSNDGTNMIIDIGVYTFFTKHDSWKKPGINSLYHLEHEQHHFDITRLYAQKLVNELRKAHFTKNNYRKLLNSIFDKIYDESITLQHQYDSETKNSMDSAKQAEWNLKINSEIGKLNSIQESAER